MNQREYRVGNHQSQNLYRGDDFIGVMFDSVDAVMIVEALNNEKFLAQPARSATYRVDSGQPRCLYRHDVFLGVMFTVEDAALVAWVMNVAAVL